MEVLNNFQSASTAVPPTEERTEEPDLGVSRGVLMNKFRFEEHVGSWEYTLQNDCFPGS